MSKYAVFALIPGFALASLASGQQPGSPQPSTESHQAMVNRTTSLLIQNEIRDLPADHSALISASREVSIELEVPSTGDLAGLEDALVTVIRPNGDTTRVRPDINGLVTVGQVETGPHAFVVSSPRAHGAKLFYFEEESPDADVAATAGSQMQLVNIGGEQLRPFMEELQDVNGPLSDLVPTLPTGPESGFRVALEADGSMRGKVLTIADRSGGLRLNRTRVAIFFRGVQVAETMCDEMGEFVVRGMRPGIHGVVVVGPDGYAVFAIESVAADAEVALAGTDERFVAQIKAPIFTVPVVLIPPPMIPKLVSAIEDFYGLNEQTPLAGEALGVPVGGFMAPPSTATSGGGGGGGGGGIGGLAALAGIAAIAGSSSDGDSLIVLPPTTSPSTPLAP